MTQVFRKIQEEHRNLWLMLASALFQSKSQVSNQVPYTSQFANPDWSEKILKDGQLKTSDPNWQESGAVTVEEYEKWVTTICGMACTVMAAAFFCKDEHKTIELAKDALEYGVYQKHSKELSSMRYKEYVDWVTNYGLYATLYSRLTTEGIEHILSEGGLVIASVNPNIRGYITAPEKQIGGHLVLVTGYDSEDKTITLQNPSGFVSRNTHHNHTLNIKEFKNHFANRGIALYKSN